MPLRSSNRGGACVSHGDNSIFPYRSGRSFLFYIVYIPYFIFSIFHQDQSFIFCDIEFQISICQKFDIEKFDIEFRVKFDTLAQSLASTFVHIEF